MRSKLWQLSRHFLTMRVVWVVNKLDLIWMAWFMSFGKEAMFGEVRVTCLFRDEVGGFRLGADNRTMLEYGAGRKISVVGSIVKQNADVVLLSTFGLDCDYNSAICRTFELFCCLRDV